MNREIKTNNGSGRDMLPADFLSKLESGIAESRATTIVAGGKPFLRLKSSDWIYGQENIDVQEGSRWIMNILSLSHGWCCWVRTNQGMKNETAELRGEIMVSMTEAKPPVPPPLDGNDYVEQRAFDLKCLDGEDAETEVQYKTNSKGGIQAVYDLLAPIQNRLLGGSAYPFPVVKLSQRHYDHRQYGRTYVPIFEIVGWADMQGMLEGAGEGPDEVLDGPEKEPAVQEPVTARRARRAVRAVEEAPEPVAVVSTQQAHVAQRRRPTR